MRIIIVLLFLFASASNAAGIYPETVKRVGLISDRYAVDRMEAFLWGFGWAANSAGCEPEKGYHFRKEAETAWLEIKYNSKNGDNFIQAAGDWANKNYRCEYRDAPKEEPPPAALM